MNPETELSRRMRDLHATGAELPQGWLDQAEAFDKASAEWITGAIGPKEFLGHFARTRRMWCAQTGEPLV